MRTKEGQIRQLTGLTLAKKLEHSRENRARRPLPLPQACFPATTCQAHT